VYLVEGASAVGVVGDITKLSSYRWMAASITQTSTPTVVSVDVEALTNGYYRVYVANTAGLLSAPAINKVTISITRASTVALTCATGATCVVGDTGPGGGIVFYVGSFTASGTACNTTCRYLEAAPADSSPGIAWCSDTATLLGTTVGGGTGAIGNGPANTALMLATCTSGAANSAVSYISPNNTADWFLPSKGELNLMYTNLHRATPALGGFATAFYWSSSENFAYVAWNQYFYNGNQYYDFKYYAYYVRPVRAF
jgi:hypothetical protein